MKAFYQRFFLLSRAKQIALSVVVVHLAVLVALIAHHLMTCRWRSTKPILVKTIVHQNTLKNREFNKERSQNSHSQQAGLARGEAPIENANCQPSPAQPKPDSSVGFSKKPAPTTGSAKSGTAKADPAKTTSTLAKPKDKAISQKKESKAIGPASVGTNSWKEIAQTLNTFATEEPKTATTSLALPIPTKGPPSFEQVSYAEDPTYGEYLTAFLQNTLELPEYGDVKIQIEIDDFGQLVHCQILETKSKKNASFLQETLPSLHFPIPQLGPFEKTKTISITFRNK